MAKKLRLKKKVKAALKIKRRNFDPLLKIKGLIITRIKNWAYETHNIILLSEENPNKFPCCLSNITVKNILERCNNLQV